MPGRATAALAVLLALAAPLAAQRATERYDHHFRKYAKRYFGAGFDWRLFKAQGIAESGLDSAATSPAGARGVMQLLPSTFEAIRSRNPELVSIDHPEWNIAAGIKHDRSMWRLWREAATPRDRVGFMFASYNAGRTTILRAQEVARAHELDPKIWTSIEAVAGKVGRWRDDETLGYLRTIETTYRRMDQGGRLRPQARPQ